ncbi:MAG: M18 family aminopeptidase, partial [Myxococcota bacterium]|nr:M18 family aminopeptidase [Myxococcota bacterium]
MSDSTHATTQDLLRYIHASPTPIHCVAESARRLEMAGFRLLDPGAAWDLQPGQGYWLSRRGTLIAFRVGKKPSAEAGFRILGAHTDSPNLRVKPVADTGSNGYLQLGVETYGGLLDYTWLDKDLGLAGSVMLQGDGPVPEEMLVRVDRPILRIASLAIHLNREIRADGFKLNAQKHLAPLLGLGENEEGQGGALNALLSAELDVDPSAILSWDLSLMDLVPPTVGGMNGEFIFAPRLDNQGMSHAALEALLRASACAATQVTALY